MNHFAFQFHFPPTSIHTCTNVLSSASTKKKKNITLLQGAVFSGRYKHNNSNGIGVEQLVGEQCDNGASL